MRVSYVKVAEFQRRGALHFHLVLRLDGVSDGRRASRRPPARFDGQLLIERRSRPRGTCRSSPRSRRPADRLPAAPGQARIRWGAQLEVRELDARGSAEDAASCAGYIAKYATKSTEAVGGLMYRLDARRHPAPECARTSAATSSARGASAATGICTRCKLRRWAHSLGFRGHCFTKSRRYSTTFTALRQARHEHQLRRARRATRRDAATCGAGTSVGRGYRTLGDAWLAESGRKRALEQRRVAREELRTGHRCARERHEGRRQMSQIEGQSEQFMTAREVAERVGLSPDTILRYYREGRIPGPAAAGADPPGAVPVE